MATERTDTYHHGHLRQALLDAAMGLVRERGVEGLTLREVARRAGVSHNAPYHHFVDRGALVSALAVDGFRRFEEAFRAALEGIGESRITRIRAIGAAYVRFAFDDPARFTLMWRPELRSVGDDSEVDQAGLASYQVLIDEIVSGQAAGEIREGDAGLLALAAWSLVHGLAMLIVDGPLRDQVTAWSMVEPLLDPVLDMAERGLVA
jgi:AcrR family transcriptional regulator